MLLKGRNHLIGNGFERQMVFETGFGIGRNFVLTGSESSIPQKI